jgi:hypothetical protein
MAGLIPYHQALFRMPIVKPLIAREWLFSLSTSNYLITPHPVWASIL